MTQDHEQRETGGQQVLPAEHGGHRLHVDGMHREEEPSHPGYGQRDAPGHCQAEDQDRNPAVQEDVDEVVAPGVEARHLVVEGVGHQRQGAVEIGLRPTSGPHGGGEEPGEVLQGPDKDVVDDLHLVVVDPAEACRV
jgi:hypothetical protein